MVHQLKIFPNYFEDVISGKKRFEFRINDRNFKVHDFLALNEYDYEKKTYTGRSCLVYVDYIMDCNTAEGVPALKDNLVIMSISPVNITVHDNIALPILIGEERIQK